MSCGNSPSLYFKIHLLAISQPQFKERNELDLMRRWVIPRSRPRSGKLSFCYQRRHGERCEEERPRPAGTVKPGVQSLLQPDKTASWVKVNEISQTQVPAVNSPISFGSVKCRARDAIQSLSAASPLRSTKQR
eukprot:643157-Hanusia_phi.AAC.7